MKYLLILALLLSFGSAAILLPFSIAPCGDAHSAVCSSLGMQTDECMDNAIQHHTDLVKRPLLCLVSTVQTNILPLFLIISLVLALALLSVIQNIRIPIRTYYSRIFHLMNPFDPLRFALLQGTIQQKKNVRSA